MMDYAQPTCSQALAAGYSPTSYWDTSPCSPSSKRNHAANPCTPGCSKDGFPQTCTSIAETCSNSTFPHGPDAWIASQRASLARIFRARDWAKASKAHGPALSGRCSEQLTLFGPESSSSKTRQKSSPKVDATLSGLSWRGDIPGATERLPLLLSERVTSGTAGGCSLPTVTACGNWNRKGASANSGDGLVTAIKKLPTLTASMETWGDMMDATMSGTDRKKLPTLTASEVSGGRTVPPGTTMSGKTPEGKKVQVGLKGALKRLPTLCASDYKSPYSEEGYQKQALQRCKPLRDTLAHITGHALTPEFAEWWMGWPILWSSQLKYVIMPALIFIKKRKR